MATERTLLEGIIDYAGVFPPARHPLATALQVYRTATSGPDGWLLGPFLCPASQLPELNQLLSAGEHIAIGAVLDIPADQMDRAVDQVELKVDAGRFDYGPISEWAPVVYSECRTPSDLTFLDSIQRARDAGLDVRAKIRTGGESAVSFPSIEHVSAFLARCIQRGIPFKATAGLHSPFRHESTIEGATEHGFVNLLAATRATLVDPSKSAYALAATEPSEFDMVTAAWDGIGRDIDAAVVRESLRSFGSCSFEEPAGYLRDLGMLDT